MRENRFFDSQRFEKSCTAGFPRPGKECRTRQWSTDRRLAGGFVGWWQSGSWMGEDPRSDREVEAGEKVGVIL